MTVETEVLWLDERRVVSFAELVRLSGLAPAELEELVQVGVITTRAGNGEAPGAAAGATLEFSARMVTVARTASRLRDELELDTAGLGVAVKLLERVRDLETEIARLRAQLPRG